MYFLLRHIICSNQPMEVNLTIWSLWQKSHGGMIKMTKMIKKNLAVLILSVAIVVVSVSVVSFVSFGEESRNVTVLGITLGKSLGAAGFRECCRSQGAYSFKSYDLKDTSCYQTTDCGNDVCFTQVIPELSFNMTVDVFLLDNCDRESPVQEIRATFGFEDYGKVLSLMIGKFGQPAKTEKSMVQNSMGVKFQKTESFWNKRGLSMYLTNDYHETDLGLLQIARQDKKRSVAQDSREENKLDRKIF